MHETNSFPTYAMLYNKLTALFGDDPDLVFSLDDSTRTATISSRNSHKLAALQRALNLEKFAEGGLTVVFTECTREAVTFLHDLFDGNPHFSRIYLAHDAMGGVEHPICYFLDETIQYAADDRFVPNGYETRLAEQLVEELFNEEALQMKYITEEKLIMQAPTDEVFEDECADCRARCGKEPCCEDCVCAPEISDVK